MSDLTTDLLNYIPENQRNSPEFREYVKIMGTVLQGFRDSIDDVYSYVDPLTIPENKLDLMANHIGVNFVSNVNARAKREYLNTAMQLFKANGTEAVLKYIFRMVGWSVNVQYAFGLDNSNSIALIEGSKYVPIDSWSSGGANDDIPLIYTGWEDLICYDHYPKTWSEADTDSLVDDRMLGTKGQADRRPDFWEPRKDTTSAPVISDSGTSCDSLRYYKSGGQDFGLYIYFDNDVDCVSNPDSMLDADKLLWGVIEYDEYGSQWARVVNASGEQALYPLTTESYKKEVLPTAPRVRMYPYLRLRIGSESYELWTKEIFEGSDRFDYTAQELFDLSAAVRNFFLEEVRPANVRIVDIAAPTGMKDNLAPEFQTNRGDRETTNTSAMQRYSGILSYGYDQDPFNANQIYGEVKYREFASLPSFPYADDSILHTFDDVPLRPKREDYWLDFVQSGEYGGPGSGVTQLIPDAYARTLGDYDYYDALDEWSRTNQYPVYLTNPTDQVVRRKYPTYFAGMQMPATSRRQVYLEAELPEDSDVTFWLCYDKDRRDIDYSYENIRKNWTPFQFNKRGYVVARLLDCVAVAAEIRQKIQPLALGGDEVVQVQSAVNSSPVSYRLRWVPEQYGPDDQLGELPEPPFPKLSLQLRIEEPLHLNGLSDDISNTNLLHTTGLYLTSEFNPLLAEYGIFAGNSLLITETLTADEDVSTLLSSYTDNLRYARVVDGVQIRYSNFLMVNKAAIKEAEFVPELWTIVDADRDIYPNYRYFINNTTSDIKLDVTAGSFEVGESCVVATNNTSSFMTKLGTTNYLFHFDDGTSISGADVDFEKSTYFRLVCVKPGEIHVTKI